jgi:hypothetical protein
VPSNRGNSSGVTTSTTIASGGGAWKALAPIRAIELHGARHELAIQYFQCADCGDVAAKFNSVPDEGTAGVDEGIRFGAEHASSYFTNIFWKECKLPRIDDRIIAQRLFGLSTVPIDATSPHSIISYLRDSGAATFGGALGIPDLPSDAFTLWATNYRHFGQREMATRMENLTTALDAFVDQGLHGHYCPRP